MLEIKLTSHEQYLFGRLFSRNAKKTHADQSALQIFVTCLKRKDSSQTFRSSSSEKHFPPVCMFYIQLAPMIVFHSMWSLKDIIFCKSFLLFLYFFNRYVGAFFETSVLKGVRISCYLHNNSAVLIPISFVSK